MLIDSHCHLDAKWFANDIPAVIQNAKQNGIEAIITSSIDITITKTKNIVDRYPNYVFWALGLHPPGVNPQNVKAIITLMKKHKAEIVAIGEVGLDYYWVKEENLREQQKDAFKNLINLAIELDKPIVIHARDAQTDTINILEENNAENVLMHCFSGNEKEAKRIIHNKWLISVPTSVVKRQVHQTMAKIVPLDLMLLETDAPYLSPAKGRNEPANIRISAQKVAELKSVSFEEVARITTANAQKFYRLDDKK
ncbi:MAG TPA: TatD family hydrolase [Candidatus Deferrimicrobium sp.]|nr:TatD family hydrolase [Candidatus Deferrimicrobium sp.]